MSRSNSRSKNKNYSPDCVLIFVFSENGRRPKSCVEAANPWYLQKQPKNPNTRMKSEPISEDSGNSSLSASIGSIRDRARKSKNFLMNH